MGFGVGDGMGYVTACAFLGLFGFRSFRFCDERCLDDDDDGFDSWTAFVF